jgi:hypothetical protein
VSRKKRRLGSWLLASAIAILTLLTSCGLPQITAQERVFLDLSLDFLGEYQLPNMKFKDTLVGGLSGLTYDRQQNRFYAISDDRSNFAPARFYTLKLVLNDANKYGQANSTEPLDNPKSNATITSKIGIQKVEIENVTFLRDKNGNTFAKNTTDTEGIALTPQKSVFISSEGFPSKGIPPFVNEFDLKSGRQQQSLPIPERYIPDSTDAKKRTRGIQDNLGFESLTLNPTGTIPARGEPFRLFTVTESALVQDKDPVEATKQSESPPKGSKCRMLHYLLSDGPPTLISEHLYQLEPPPPGAIKHGLPDLLALDQGGHFLTLERSAGLLGFNVRIYQAATGGATDTSRIASFKGELRGIEPIKKKLLLDLDELGISLDNLEGMALGPRLPDGSESLLLVSDNNFNDYQVTQFLLFSLQHR